MRGKGEKFHYFLQRESKPRRDACGDVRKLALWMGPFACDVRSIMPKKWGGVKVFPKLNVVYGWIMKIRRRLTFLISSNIDTNFPSSNSRLCKLQNRAEGALNASEFHITSAPLPKERIYLYQEMEVVASSRLTTRTHPSKQCSLCLP